MRKVIWGCIGGGALVVCGAFAATQYAVENPQSGLARALHGASHLAATASPYAGFGPMLERLEGVNSTKADEVSVDLEGIPEPTPDAPVAGSIDAPKEAPPIVIPEGPAPGTTLPETVEVPVSKELTAPLTMPLVDDGEESEVEQAVVEEVEHRSWWMKITGWFKSRATPAGLSTALDQWGAGEAPQECREDRHYHHHYPGCPYTGLPFGLTPRAEPVALPPMPLKNTGAEEPSEEPAPSAALKSIRKIRLRTSIPEYSPTNAPGVDTMEYRPSDRPLYDFGPGQL